jgi:glycosyltransferase involved in cell wall biosynthesis/ubiquinone/menaquinone biosynthesis C-methylase UbiE
MDGLTERHKITLTIPSLTPTNDAFAEAQKQNCTGVVIEPMFGWASHRHLLIARRFLRNNLKVFFYWPNENAIELIDQERLGSYWRLGMVVRIAYGYSNLKNRLIPIYRAARSLARKIFGSMGLQQFAQTLAGNAPPPELPSDIASNTLAEAGQLASTANPKSVTDFASEDNGHIAVNGYGVYLRTDFWVKINSGGSYGHTCYVAKELAHKTGNFVCFTASHFELLDQFGLRQIVLAPPGPEATESNFLKGTSYYYLQLHAAIKTLKPAYIYERLCLGNFVGAKLSHELGVPYLVEYNGSEVSMHKSFGGTSFIYEGTYLKIEEAAFRQATAISVVSEVIKDSLVSRGVDQNKILVNPNGVDINAYRPSEPAEKETLRAGLGFSSQDRVIGFIGTFGGWHGIEILAAALPIICEKAPNARFLLIGDGTFKYLIDEQVRSNKLGNRVRLVGSIPQQDGARMLKACDIYVSPHSAHMVDSRFFGSPTKIFEYMAMGGGIVASELEQIGTVLSPGLRASDLLNPSLSITDQRSVLCKPGDLDQFVNAVLYLINNPAACQLLGKNARKAAANEFTWEKHVERLFDFAKNPHWITKEPASSDTNDSNLGPALKPQHSVTGLVADLVDPDSKRQINTGDAYKNEVQNQWDNNPCGSQYVKIAQPHSLEWFVEAEAYRHGEYGPWMPETMEFSLHAGKHLLEIGGGMGTDLAQFAEHGAIVTDVDLSSGHLALAQENFRLRGLTGTFIHQDAETLPFPDNSFDVVYSNGVIHHTPNTQSVIDEIYRVLKPGGKAIIMVYAENSLYYWRNLVGWLGLTKGALMTNSIGHVMSCSVEMSDNNARPLVKVYTKSRIRKMFKNFNNVEICQRQLVAEEVPRGLGWVPLPWLGKLMGWNLILKAHKPR